MPQAFYTKKPHAICNPVRENQTEVSWSNNEMQLTSLYYDFNLWNGFIVNLNKDIKVIISQNVQNVLCKK